MRKVLLSAALLAASAAHADQFGSWWVDRMDDHPAYFALTSNDAGGILGKLCEQSGCRWILTVKTNCEKGNTYPALLSAKTGAYPLTLQCEPNGKAVGRYVILDYAVLENAVSQGEQVGIAMPLQSGEFRVARYPIGGWSAAAAHLAGRVRVMFDKTGEKNL